MSRFRRRPHVAATAALVAFAAMACAAEPSSRPASRPAVPDRRPAPDAPEEAEGEAPVKTKAGITLSRETTYITGPLNEDGTVNYVEYLNRKYGKGVTPENNAAVLMLKALGPGVVNKDSRGEFLKRLGMDELREDGAYFLDLADYLRALPAEQAAELPQPAEKSAVWQAELNQAMSELWQREDHPTIAAWLAANAKPLKLFGNAAQRNRLFFPLVPAHDPPIVFCTLLPSLGGIRDAAKALSARAMLRAGGGDWDGAMADLQTVRRLGWLFSQDGILLHRLVGLAVDSIGMDATQLLLTTGVLAEGEVHALFEDLRAVPAHGDIREPLAHERFNGLDAIMILARGDGEQFVKLMGALAEIPEVGEPKRVDYRVVVAKAIIEVAKAEDIAWDAAIRAHNTWFDAVAEPYPDGMSTQGAAKTEDSLEALQAAKWRVRRDPAKWGAELTRKRNETAGERQQRIGRKIGEFMSVHFIAQLGRAASLQKGREARRYALLAAAALAVHRAETGEFPKKLAELTPKLLEQVPADPFTGEPLIYRRTEDGYVLYSVGPDLEDDGGVENEDDREEGDLVVRVPPDVADEDE